ncbi:MAG TPA: HAMP domain-containing sensor histidine kinase [Ensifer sp.]|nr:HAMP domain-containing sensor histidine kinase [Ensifer sp.]
MTLSLKLRLGIGAFAAIILALALMAATLANLFATYVADRYRSEMSALADSIAATIIYRNGRFSVGHPPPDPRFDVAAGGRYWQVSAPGQEPVRSASLWDLVIDPAKLGKTDRRGFQWTEGPDGADMLVYSTRLTLTDETGRESPPFWIYCGFRFSEMKPALDGYGRTLASMMLLSAIILGVSTWLLGFYALRPLGRLQREVIDIRAGRTNSMSEDRPREILPLVREINLLLRERETAVERARARASDLAHGLKTPLTVLAQLASQLPAEDRETALKQVDLIRQRSDRQLQSARLGVEQMSSTSVAEIIKKLVQVLKPVTSTKGLHWHVLIEPDTVVATDPADLAEAAGNVLENASKWAKAHILVRVDQDADWTDIRIADDGPGAAEADFARILRRGGSMTHDDQTTGLGLAISSDIANAYGGSLSLARSELGGLEVCLRFPTSTAEKLSPA